MFFITVTEIKSYAMTIKEKRLVFLSTSAATLHGTRQVYIIQSKTLTSWRSHVYSITHAIFITEVIYNKNYSVSSNNRNISGSEF